MAAVIRIAHNGRLEDSSELFSRFGVEHRGGNFERIDDPERVADLITSLVRYEATGIITNDRHKTRVKAAACAQSMRVVTWELDDALVVAPAFVEIVGFNSVFHVPVAVGFQSGSRLVTPYPDFIYVGRRRWLRRARASSDLDAALVLESGRRIDAAVRDLSYDGLAISVAGVDLPPGAPVDLEVDDGRGPARLRCDVRTLVPQLGDQAVVLGLRVVAATPKPRWIDIVNAQLHPRTEIGSRMCDEVWALYQRCGYFELSGKHPEEFVRLKRAFASVSRQLDRAPHLGAQVSWPTRDRSSVVATASALKVYSGTWLGLQMAKDSGDSPDGVSGRRILRELNNRIMEHWQLDPEFRWFCTYIQSKKVWTRFVFHDGMQRFKSGGEAAFVRFRALEMSVGARFGGDDALVIDGPSDGEKDALSDYVLLSRPRAYVEAFDLTRERLDLADNRRAWRGSRLERDRVILVARRRGRAVAAAVLELAADGLHLFGLLDLVRLYPLAPDGASAFDGLLDAAAAWFAARDKERFCVFVEDDVALRPETVAQARDLGEADMCILAARRVPDLLELIHELTAPRTPAAT
jgi:hypothetical protein